MEEQEIKITSIRHPEYTNWITDWQKFRSAFKGGKAFVEEYLKEYSSRENVTDFTLRKEMSYCPAHAKATLLEVKNSIYQRLVTVVRKGGPESYQQAILGKNRGVDLQGRTMDDFIGSIILEELIVIGKVGVYVDKQVQEETETVLDAKDKRPYLYYYTAENILSWAYNDNQELSSLLLRDERDIVDEETGLITGAEEIYRLIQLVEDGVLVTFYDVDDIEQSQHLLNLKRIPFVFFEISSSLMTDVADYQIALTQLASSDIQYSVQANFPFYVEQYNQSFEMSSLKGATPADDGGSDDAKTSSDKEINTGVSKGRRYPAGFDAPSFIHPSAEPLTASMAKQKALQIEIRQLINVSIANLEPTQSSEESKKEDANTLEAGLSYIGMELNYGEREISEIWAMYEGSKTPAIVQYPTDYTLMTDEERRKAAEEDEKMMGKIPSKTYKKEMVKRIVKLTLGTTATPGILDTINKEIDSAAVIISDPEVLRSDHEAGFVSDATASQLRGYSEDEYIQAQKDHAARAVRVLAAQTGGDAARGNEDTDPDIESGKTEKAGQQNPDTNIDGSDGTRGKGK